MCVLPPMILDQIMLLWLLLFQHVFCNYFIPFVVGPVITRPLLSYTLIGGSISHGIVPYSTVFRCSAEGFPIPTIEWRRINDDGSEVALTSGEIILITEFFVPGPAVSSRFMIRYTNLTIFGVYACVATNDFGSDNATLTVEGKDHCTYIIISLYSTVHFVSSIASCHAFNKYYCTVVNTRMYVMKALI